MTRTKFLVVLFLSAAVPFVLAGSALARQHKASEKSAAAASEKSTEHKDLTTAPGTPSTTLMGGSVVDASSSDDTLHPISERAMVIRFEAGKNALSALDEERLRNLVAGIGADNIDRIEVAAWSDRSFPKKTSDLPKADRDLASQRASKIESFLKSQLDISGMKVKTFNMAETSNWLARTMRTEDAELKSIFAKEGGAQLNRVDFNYIAREGAPSRAVVVVVRK